jgi:transcriptional regulator with XRE-family HTH domain
MAENVDQDRAARRVGERIRAQRHNKNISLRALARELGVSPQAVSNWENGANLPSHSHMARIGEFLDQDQSTLFPALFGRGEDWGATHASSSLTGKIPVLSARAAGEWQMIFETGHMYFDHTIGKPTKNSTNRPCSPWS